MRVVNAAIALFFFAAFPLATRADDFGPRRDVAQIRSDTPRLLAQRVRRAGADPKAIRLTDVVVVRDQALLSWDSGKQHGVMGLVRHLDRWWDALDAYRSDAKTWGVFAAPPLQQYYNTIQMPHDIDGRALKARGFSDELIAAALAHNNDVAQSQVSQSKAGGTAEFYGQEASNIPIKSEGAALWTWRQNTAGYDIHVTYAKNDASPGTKFTRIYGRAPTAAEMLPNPPPPRDWGGSTDVGYFDLEIGGNKVVTVQPGTKVDIWFPFALDDQLRYRLSFVSADKIYPPIRGTIFDNVLHFELPSFTLAPGKTFQAEIEGWW